MKRAEMLENETTEERRSRMEQMGKEAILHRQMQEKERLRRSTGAVEQRSHNDSEQSFSELKCPRCRSTNLTASNKGFGLGKAVVGGALLGPVGLLGGLVGSKDAIFTCLKCGNQFEKQSQGVLNGDTVSVMHEQKIMHEVETACASENRNSTSTDVYEQIKKLGELRKADILTEEEFNNKKGITFK